MTKSELTAHSNWDIHRLLGECRRELAELLDEEHLEWIESPLHDRDVNATESLKAPYTRFGAVWRGKDL